MSAVATLTRRPSPGNAQRQAVRLRAEIVALAGGHGNLLVHSERSWASITFAGRRHRLTYAFDGAEAVEHAETMIALLPEHEFAIPGQLVADAAVVSVDHRIHPPRLVADLELLLLDED